MNHIVPYGVLLLAVCLKSVTTCNKNVCASLVSKCLLLKSCECDMTDIKNCTCCRQCHQCLARLYTECCSCVGMCPDHNEPTDWLKSSTVEELEDPLPELFEVLTEEEDLYLRWTTFNYPAHLDLLYFKPRDIGDFGLNLGSHFPDKPEEEHVVRHGGHHIALDPASAGRNCTVAYMTPCMSLGRCRKSCTSMGAARFRWFHAHGCCECIGSTCLDFGKGEPHCLKCPDQKGALVDEADEFLYEEEFGGEGGEYEYVEDYESGEEEEMREEQEGEVAETAGEDIEAEINSYLNGYVVAGGGMEDVHKVRKVGELN